MAIQLYPWYVTKVSLGVEKNNFKLTIYMNIYNKPWKHTTSCEFNNANN